MFRLGKRKLWGDPFLAFQYIKGAYKKDKDFLLRPIAKGQQSMALNCKRMSLDRT